MSISGSKPSMIRFAASRRPELSVEEGGGARKELAEVLFVSASVKMLSLGDDDCSESDMS